MTKTIRRILEDLQYEFYKNTQESKTYIEEDDRDYKSITQAILAIEALVGRNKK